MTWDWAAGYQASAEFNKGHDRSAGRPLVAFFSMRAVPGGPAVTAPCARLRVPHAGHKNRARAKHSALSVTQLKQLFSVPMRSKPILFITYLFSENGQMTNWAPCKKRIRY